MFQRLLDMLAGRPSPPNDERSKKERELERLHRKTVVSQEAATDAQKAAAEMVRQSKLDSYSRVKLPPPR